MRIISYKQRQKKTMTDNETYLQLVQEAKDLRVRLAAIEKQLRNMDASLGCYCGPGGNYSLINHELLNLQNEKIKDKL